MLGRSARRTSLPNLIVYDVETTDADTRNAQVTQFAGIKVTDGEIVDQVDLRIRLLPYVVPSPEALRVTGVDPASLIDPTLPTEYEATEVIRRFLDPVRGLL
jgi:exodeoxyribonuclease-1